MTLDFEFLKRNVNNIAYIHTIAQPSKLPNSNIFNTIFGFFYFKQLYYLDFEVFSIQEDSLEHLVHFAISTSSGRFVNTSLLCF